MNPKRPKRVALYLRVSTSEQTTRNQRRELHAVAQRHGWHVVAIYEDAGVSGAKGRDERPGFDRLMMAFARREIDMVAAWSADRLGRSLTDLLNFLIDLDAKRVDLFLHQQGLDTSTPSGRAMFQMLGVFAEFERAMIRERVMAGLARARADGKQLGRRTVEQSHARKVKSALVLRAKGIGIRRIARAVRAYAIKTGPAGAAQASPVSAAEKTGPPHPPDPFRSLSVCRRKRRQHCANEYSPPHIGFSIVAPSGTLLVLPLPHGSRSLSLKALSYITAKID